MNISLYGSNQRETEQSKNRTFYKWTRLLNEETQVLKNNCFLNTTKHYSYKNELQDVSWCFKDFLPQNFLILPLLLLVWWMVTKCTFIGIALEDIIAIYQPETVTLITIMEHTIVLHGEKWFATFVYSQPKTDTFIA